MEKFFSEQIEAHNRLGGNVCPGEEVCLITGPLAKYKHQPIEETCAGCEKRATKPGSQPTWLLEPIADAIYLDEVKTAGGMFAYPDGLTVREWIALRALERARAKDREQQLKQSQSNQQSETARLQARLGRG